MFEFCERWPTSAPLRDVLSGGVETIASENPHVEVVLKKRMFKEPVVRGFYREFAKALPFATLHHDECLDLLFFLVNGRSKEVCLKGLSHSEVTQRIQLLLDSSGAKIKALKGHPVQSTTPSVRGVWSGMHVEEPLKI